MYNMTEAGIECVRSLNVEYLPLKCCGQSSCIIIILVPNL